MALAVRRIALALAVMLAAGRLASADAADDRRALVMLRALAYDDHLGDRVGDEVRVIIVYPDGDAGLAEGRRWTQAFARAHKLKVAGRPVVVVARRFDRALGDALGRAAAIVACDGLGRAIAELAAVTRAHHVLSLATRERDVAAGLALGVVPGETRDQIVVNLAAAAAEGVKFDAGLLQLARAVEGPR